MSYIESYASYLRGFADLKRPLRVVFDCSNGTAGIVLKELKIKNLELKIINSKTDGRFPAHGPNPLLPSAMRQLQREVLKNKADLGVVFDADGDRAFFVDNGGRFLPSYLVAQLLFLENSGHAVADAVVYKALEKLGASRVRKIFPSRVGTYFMKRVMREKRADFGVEFSGHYYFKDFFYSDSGILVAVKVMNALSKLPYSLADFWDMQEGNIYLENFNFYAKDQDALFKKINKRYRKRAERVWKIDGLTFDFGDSWFTARPSNTEPLVRFFIGSKNKENFDKLLRDCRTLF